ncbi:hypothetical protein THOE12_10029 [Vibrio rotiferianus]|nr:hypothetical protein THOE12_10029 [Vibrio rotiferianus]
MVKISSQSYLFNISDLEFVIDTNKEVLSETSKTIPIRTLRCTVQSRLP